MASLPGTPDCCWLATAPRTDYPRLMGSLSCDVAVVGAGIVGLTAALSLTEAGLSVAMLEGRRVGGQVTGRSTAKVTTQHALIYRHLIETFGRETAAFYADANRTGGAAHPPVDQRLRDRLPVRAQGRLRLCARPGTPGRD